MEKRALSTLLALYMLLSLIPGTVLAENPPTAPASTYPYTVYDLQSREPIGEDQIEITGGQVVITLDPSRIDFTLSSSGDGNTGSTGVWAYWAGIGIEAPADAAKVHFKRADGSEATQPFLDPLVGEHKGFAVWLDAGNASFRRSGAEYTITWKDADNADIEPTYTYLIRLAETPKLAEATPPDIREATLADASGDIGPLYEAGSYHARGEWVTDGNEPVGNYIKVTIEAEQLAEHRADDLYKTLGHWVGFHVDAPEGAVKAYVKAGATAGQVKVSGTGTPGDLVEDDEIDIYFNVNATSKDFSKPWVVIQWRDAHDRVISTTYYYVTFQGTLKGEATSDATPDKPTPDKPTPDEPTPGEPPSDDPTPGNPTPGEPTPGEPTPGDATPDATPSESTPGTTPGTPSTSNPAYYAVNISSNILHGTVASSHSTATAGTSVTITVSPDIYYSVSWVEVTRAGGQMLPLSQSGNQYTFTMPAASVTVNAGFASSTYVPPQSSTTTPTTPSTTTVPEPIYRPITTRSAAAMPDVPSSNWAYTAAQWAYQNGYLDLAADGSFSPKGSVNHLHMWKLMSNWLGESATDNASVSAWANQSGAARFGNATDAMTRQDLVLYLYQVYFLMGGKVSESGSLIRFRDGQTILSGSTKNAWIWAVGKGLIEGTANGYLNPDGILTRSEFASVLMRLCRK